MAAVVAEAVVLVGGVCGNFQSYCFCGQATASLDKVVVVEVVVVKVVSDVVVTAVVFIFSAG